MQSKYQNMEVINSNAAGIDVGSRSHFVAVGQGTEDVIPIAVLKWSNPFLKPCYGKCRSCICLVQ
jgi:transposase